MTLKAGTGNTNFGFPARFAICCIHKTVIHFDQIVFKLNPEILHRRLSGLLGSISVTEHYRSAQFGDFGGGKHHFNIPRTHVLREYIMHSVMAINSSMLHKYAMEVWLKIQ